jgi:hypothetical protein
VVYTMLVLLAICAIERVIPVGPATASTAPTWTEVAARRASGRDHRLVPLNDAGNVGRRFSAAER